MSEYIPVELRRIVSERASRCCEYCLAQAKFSSDPMTIDHIQPHSLEGITELENLALCCFGCNQHKSERISYIDSLSEKIVPLFHPRQNNWNEHFVWNESFTLIIGLTSTGRATIDALKLNRTGLVNLRRALFQIGEHPPHR